MCFIAEALSTGVITFFPAENMIPAGTPTPIRAMADLILKLNF